MNNSYELTKEYIIKGNKTFLITNIDRMRDGGTVGIFCSGDPTAQYYISEDLVSFHNGYPLTTENKITDDVYIRYIIDRMRYFVDRQNERLNNLRYILSQISDNEPVPPF